MQIINRNKHVSVPSIWHPHERRKTFLSDHHLTPKSRRSDGLPDYGTIRIWRDKHDVWHKIFGVLTIDEIIEVVSKRKLFKNINPHGWRKLFGLKSRTKVLLILLTIRRRKKARMRRTTKYLQKIA